MKQRIIKITGIVMMLVFLAAIAPKEYLHELFFDHHDTVEAPQKKGDVVISKKHVHCSLLGFEFGPYIATAAQILTFEETVYNADYQLPFYERSCSTSFYVVCLRGPPGHLS